MNTPTLSRGERAMMNRRERKAIERHIYVAATWAAAEHYIRLGRWAIAAATRGEAVDFTGGPKS